MIDKPPEDKTRGNLVYEAAQAIAAAIPVAGGPLQVAFESMFSAPLERRKQAWLVELIGIVNEIQERVKGQEVTLVECDISVGVEAEGPPRQQQPSIGCSNLIRQAPRIRS